MLVQFTPVSALPADVRARLQQRLAAQPLLMSHEPFMFEGFHLSGQEVSSLQRAAKTSGNPTGQPLFG